MLGTNVFVLKIQIDVRVNALQIGFRLIDVHVFSEPVLGFPAGPARRFARRSVGRTPRTPPRASRITPTSRIRPRATSRFGIVVFIDVFHKFIDFVQNFLLFDQIIHGGDFRFSSAGSSSPSSPSPPVSVTRLVPLVARDGVLFNVIDVVYFIHRRSVGPGSSRTAAARQAFIQVDLLVGVGGNVPRVFVPIAHERRVGGGSGLARSEFKIFQGVVCFRRGTCLP